MPIMRDWKDHKLINVRYFDHELTRPKGPYPALPSDYIVGAKTIASPNINYGAKYSETLERWIGGRRTNMFALHIPTLPKPVIVDATPYEYGMEAFLLTLLTNYGSEAKRPSQMKKRPKRKRETDDKSAHRDGSRAYVAQVVVMHHGLEKDYIHLLGNHPQFKKLVMLGADGYNATLGELHIEVRNLRPYGSAPSYEFLVVQDGLALRVIGRDIKAYLDEKLRILAQAFIDEGIQVPELDEAWEKRYWESFTPDEIEVIKEYLASNAKIIHQLYEKLVEYVTAKEPKVILKSGLLPKSVASAAVRMMKAQASKDRWAVPPPHVMQLGAYGSAGPKVFATMKGYIKDKDATMVDQNSQEPWIYSHFPDPCDCEYRDIEPCTDFIFDDWRGKQGMWIISGQWLDKKYPAIREHTQTRKSLRYITGAFHYKITSIQSTLMGMSSGRLVVTEIHGGVEVVGSNEASYFRRHAELLHQSKELNRKNKPKRTLDKKLLVMPTGKLSEKNRNKQHIDPLAKYLEIPRSAYDEFEDQLQAHLDGDDQFRELAYEQFGESDDPDNVISLRDTILEHTARTTQAGFFYSPFHYAMVKDMATGMLALAASCTDATMGYADSLLTPGDPNTGLAQFREYMDQCGFPVPESGMGAFEVKLTHAEGWIGHGGLYSIKGMITNTETGEVTIVEKEALHSLVWKGDETARQLIEQLVKTGQTIYPVRPHETKLMEALVVHEVPGTIRGFTATVHNNDNPYTEIDEEGNITWKTYTYDPKAQRQAMEAIALLQRARRDKEQLDAISEQVEDTSNASKKSRDKKPPGNRSLSNEDAAEIRVKYKTGNYSQRVLAKEYNISPRTLRRIIEHTTYWQEPEIPEIEPVEPHYQDEPDLIGESVLPDEEQQEQKPDILVLPINNPYYSVAETIQAQRELSDKLLAAGNPRRVAFSHRTIPSTTGTLQDESICLANSAFNTT